MDRERLSNDSVVAVAAGGDLAPYSEARVNEVRYSGFGRHLCFAQRRRDERCRFLDQYYARLVQDSSVVDVTHPPCWGAQWNISSLVALHG